MIKRTIEISQQAAHLAVRNEQLLVFDKGDRRNPRASIPCEDIGVVLIEHTGTTFTHAALARLLHHGAMVVICGRDHLPSGMLLPVGDHTEIVPRLHQQIALRKPLRKQIWKQIVQAKVRGQATNLPEGSLARSRLLALARGVRSGDPNNVEAQAARIYWQAWLADTLFRRNAEGPPPNNLLNYGYAVMRAAVARAIVAAGLTPALGIHHRHRANAFCLADDLVEPLRPLVDDCVRGLHADGYAELIPPVKTALLELLTVTVRTGEQTGPLMVHLHRMVASLVRCYQGESRTLDMPEPC